MSNTVFDKKIAATDALFEAQKIALSPMTFQAARLLRDLGVLSALHESGQVGLDEDVIAEKVGCSSYAVRVLLESGVSTGIISMKDRAYSLDKTGYYILYDPMTRVNMDYAHHVCYQGMFYLEESIKEGMPAGLRVFSDAESIYPVLSKLPKEARDSWFDFNAFYSQAATRQALEIMFENPPQAVLDIGGNNATWAIACLGYSETVDVTIVDLPGLIEEGRRNLEQAGYASRVHFQALDVRDHSVELPKGFPAIWMSHFLDCFSEQEIVSILERTASAMDAEARLFILEPYWDRQKTATAAYCLINTSLYFTAMANGKSRLYRSGEILNCIEKAGLRVVKDHDGLGVCHTLLECQKN